MGMVILRNKWIDIEEFSITSDITKFTTKKLQYCKIDIGNKMSILNVYINKTPVNYEVK